MKVFKNIVSIFILATMATTISSCGNSQNSTETAQQEVAIDTLEVDALLADAELLIDQTVVLKGLCTHTCKHGGTKIFIMGSDHAKSIRIEAAELGSFKPECVNSIVAIEGIVREQRIDEAYLVKMETEVHAQTAEKHGEKKEDGCDSEKKARGEKANGTAERIADFRAKIAERKAAEGKEYLSFYFVEALQYTIQ